MSNKAGIQYILGNTKYPDFIKNHEVFSQLTKIHKVFPGIGLPNCSEPIPMEVSLRIFGAKTTATQLINTICAYINDRMYYIIEKDKKDVADILRELCTPALIYIEENGQISLRVWKDVQTDLLKLNKGESFFKAYNKVLAITGNGNLPALESLPYFSQFSSENFSHDNNKIVFSSVDEKGAWDLATISMRGISSCQTWGSPQSNGLVGSIASRFVGLLYMTNGKDFQNHGEMMLRRTVVRYAVHKETKKPALLMERIYPQTYASEIETIKIFRDFLQKKTNLPVYSYNEAPYISHLLPIDGKFVPVLKPYCSYLDTQIASYKPGKSLEKEKEIVTHIINDFQYQLTSKLNAHIKLLPQNLEKEEKAVISLLHHYYGGGYFTSYLAPRVPETLSKMLNHINYSRNTSSIISEILRTALLSFNTSYNNKLTAMMGNPPMSFVRDANPTVFNKLHGDLIQFYKKLIIEEYKKYIKL